VSRDERTAYVVQYPGRLSAVDLATGTTRVIAQGFSDPYGVALDPGGVTAYVTESGTGTVTAVDVRTGERRTVAQNLPDIFGIVLNEQGTQAYVTLRGSGQI